MIASAMPTTPYIIQQYDHSEGSVCEKKLESTKYQQVIFFSVPFFFAKVILRKVGLSYPFDLSFL